jgi:peroxiredoxin
VIGMGRNPHRVAPLRPRRPAAILPSVPLPPGSSAPPAQALDAAGAPVALASLAASGPALLFFYKGDCGASDAAAHALPRAATIPGLAVAAVSQDDPSLTGRFARAHRLEPRVRVLVDPEPWAASEAFGVLATPTWILLAPGGRVVAALEGWSRDDVNALAARAASLAGAAPAIVSTPADGPAFRPG